MTTIGRVMQVSVQRHLDENPGHCEGRRLAVTRPSSDGNTPGERWPEVVVRQLQVVRWFGKPKNGATLF